MTAPPIAAMSSPCISAPIAIPGFGTCRRLDDLDWAPPVGNIWTDSKAAWVQLDSEQINFPKGATDRTPLFDAWTRAHQD